MMITVILTYLVLDLVDTDGLSHGGLDEEGLDVLPVLLEEGDEEVDAEHGVSSQFILGHGSMTDGSSQTEDLLELELDGSLDLGDLLGQVLVVGNGGGELTGLVQARTQETRDLLDEQVRGQEDVVLLGELLDELLVLVQLLQVISRTEVDPEGLGLVTVNLVTNDADFGVRLGDVGETDGTSETLITLGVVILQTDLEFDGLVEVTLGLLVLGGSKDGGDGLTNVGSGDFAKHDKKDCRLARLYQSIIYLILTVGWTAGRGGP